MSKNITEDQLIEWAENGRNVLFRGRRGTGKTSRFISAFERIGWKQGVDYLYFSAATMDPYVQFLGIPKEQKDESGHPFLDFVRPKAINNGEVKAIIFDEYNRAPKSIKNATMEILQFKTINGAPIPGLKFIWAAINPEDDENDQYDVEPMDPAQEDRFEIIVDIPYECDMGYFKSKYGLAIAQAAIEWWNNLAANNKIAHNKISPRRLDYALSEYIIGGDIGYVIPYKEANTDALLKSLYGGPVAERLRQLAKSGENAKEIKDFFADENFYSAAQGIVTATEDYIALFLPHIPEEKVSLLIERNTKVRNYVLRNPEKYVDILKEKINASQNEDYKIKYKNALKRIEVGNKNKYSKDIDVEENPRAIPAYSSGSSKKNKIAPEIEKIISSSPNYKTDLAQSLKTYKSVSELIRYNMTEEDCHAVLNYLNELLTEGVRPDSFIMWENIIGIVNNVTLTLWKKIEDFSVINEKYKNLYNVVFSHSGFCLKPIS